MALKDCAVTYRGFFADVSMDEYEIQSVLLPRLSVGHEREFELLLSTVDSDLYDALGVRRSAPPPLRVQMKG
jgi:hypothetical protein